MKRVKVGHYTIELEERFVERYENVTCGTIDMFAEAYLCQNYRTRNIEDAIENQTLNEIRQVLIRYMWADINICK